MRKSSWRQLDLQVLLVQHAYQARIECLQRARHGPSAVSFSSGEPAKAGAVVLAPNTGNDDAYNEWATDEAIGEVETLLCEDTYAFRVRRGSVDLDEESLGG